MKSKTIQDVAKEAGVSIATVSRVINNNYPVSKSSRSRVENAIKKLEYAPNALARGLIKKETNTIGVLTPSITNLFFSQIINGIQDSLKLKGCQIITCDTNGLATEEANYLYQLQKRQVDGIIAIDPRTESIKSGLYENSAQHIPIVLINGFNDGIKMNFVISDQESGTREAIEYLLSLGHRKIAFIRSKNGYSNEVKEHALRMTLERHHISFDPHHYILLAKGNSIETVDMAKNTFYERFQHSRNLPTAVFACNDWMAAGVLYAAQMLHIAVPQELSIIGYDNTIISQITMPKLTTVDQNMQELGISAAQMLYGSMKGNNAGYLRLTMDTKLVIRDSCAPCCEQPKHHKA